MWLALYREAAGFSPQCCLSSGALWSLSTTYYPARRISLLVEAREKLEAFCSAGGDVQHHIPMHTWRSESRDRAG